MKKILIYNSGGGLGDKEKIRIIMILLVDLSNLKYKK